MLPRTRGSGRGDNQALLRGSADSSSAPYVDCATILAVVDLIGLRATDGRRRDIPGSVSKPCSVCSEPVLYGPATLAHPLAQGEVRYVCAECIESEMVIMPPSAGMVLEVAAAGHDATSWPLQHAWGKRVRRVGS